MGKPLRVLIVEDSEDDVLLTIRALKKGGYDPVYERVEDAGAMRKAIREKTWDVILCDYQMPQFNGLAAIDLLKEATIDIPIIIVSGAIGEETAVECMRSGAHDYVIKGNLSRLVPAIERELKEAESRSQRKQAEEALRESESLIHSLIDYMHDAMIIMNWDGSILFANRAAARIIEFERPEELVGHNMIEYLHPDSFQKAAEDLEAVKADKMGFLSEYQLCSVTGRRIWVESIGGKIIFRNASANLVCIRDITERKLAEQALKESENKYRLLADNVNDVIFVLDMNLNYTYISPSVKILRGYEPAEVLKHSPSETLTPSSFDLAMRTVSEVMELEKSEHSEIPISRTLELEMRRKDGTTVWTEVKLSFIRDENQRPVGILGLTRDITERKQAEDAIRKSEEKYRGILENMDDAYYELDLKGNLVFFNEALILKTGYSREELMGMNYRQYVSPETYILVQRIFSEIYRTGQFVRLFDYEVISKGGQTRCFESWASALSDNNNKSIGFKGMARDITDRKQAEERLKETLDSLRKAFGATIQALVSAVEVRDPYTAGHQIRSADLARAIATEMGLPHEKIDGIRVAGSIHDIGKLSIPAEILSKPTRLTELEFSLIKEHSQKGYEMLKDVESPWPLAEIVYQHHERMNGSGYPRNLKGNDILMEARILAVSDVVESMASHRPYRPALGIEVALEEVEKNRGTHYDNTVVDACLKLFKEKGYKLE